MGWVSCFCRRYVGLWGVAWGGRTCSVFAGRVLVCYRVAFGHDTRCSPRFKPGLCIPCKFTTACLKSVVLDDGYVKDGRKYFQIVKGAFGPLTSVNFVTSRRTTKPVAFLPPPFLLLSQYCGKTMFIKVCYKPFGFRSFEVSDFFLRRLSPCCLDESLCPLPLSLEIFQLQCIFIQKFIQKRRAVGLHAGFKPKRDNP